MPTQPNIIVDECGNARITDFGLAAIARDPHSQRSTLDEGYTARWCAPEILEGEQLASRESDIFSFGMVMVEVGVPPTCSMPTALSVDEGLHW